MSLDFTALDFETANGFRGSPCSVGAVRVRSGVPVASAHWLMRPPEGFDRFDPRNVHIHGIRPEQVSRAPRFPAVFDELMAFVGDDALVAHNAGFDLGVIESALEVSGRDIPGIDYACSLVLARKGYDLPSYALPRAAEEAGHPVTRHHDALADAEACAWIVIDIERRTRADGADGQHRPLEHLLTAQGMQLRQLAPRKAGQGPVSRATRQARELGPVFDARVELPHEARMPDLLHWPDEGINPDPAPDADPRHPLYGQQVVFTGNLGMPRQQAKDRAAACGARPASRVGASTTLLVVGDGFRSEDLVSTTVGGAVLHRKTRDALERRSRGQRVELISEPEFLQMLDGNWPVLAP